MPASALSPLVTEVYRADLLTLRDRTQTLARTAWRNLSMDDLEGTYEQWRSLVATGVTGAQAAAQRASAGYIGAYVASESDEPVQAPPLSSSYEGKTRDGRPIAEGLRSPLIAIRTKFKQGAGLEEAMREGLNRATRMVEQSVMHAARASLNDLMEADERIKGWQRSVRGTCGACLGDIAVQVSVELPSIPIRQHPNCMCVTQPVLVRVRDLYPMATGKEIVDRMSPAEQDANFGKQVAEKLRTEEVSLADLVGTSAQQSTPDFITQKTPK